jgi:gamma-glutamyl:cysteine ligase YbdK (ATP-grasp superfamily)
MSAISYKQFTLGIEEEYMVIDPVSRELKSHKQKIVQEGQKIFKEKVKAEMHQAVVEQPAKATVAALQHLRGGREQVAEQAELDRMEY